MTKKQSLVKERCWMNYGSLSGIAVRLEQIAMCKSTLPEEAKAVGTAAHIIRNVLSTWKRNYSKVKGD